MSKKEDRREKERGLSIMAKPIFYDYMIPPKAIKIVSNKLQIKDHIIHPDAVDGYILMGWDEIKRLYQTDLFNSIEFVPHKDSVYTYNNQNQKEYIDTRWMMFSELVTSAQNDIRCGYPWFYASDQPIEKQSSEDFHNPRQREYVFYDVTKGPRQIRLVSEALQLDKYIEQDDCRPIITLDDLLILENTGLFEKILFNCKDALYSYLLANDGANAEKIDCNDRWWKLSDVVLMKSV